MLRLILYLTLLLRHLLPRPDLVIDLYPPLLLHPLLVWSLIISTLSRTPLNGYPNPWNLTMRLVKTCWLLPRFVSSASIRSSLSSLARMLVRLIFNRLDRWSLEPVFEPRKTSSTVRTRKIANNLRLLSTVSVLLVIPFRLFSVYCSSAGSPTYIRPGNVFEYALIPGKYTYILLRCIGNRPCTLVTLEPVRSLVLGTSCPPSYALYPGYFWICKLPRLNPLWIRLDDGPVNSAKSSLGRLRIGIVYISRLDTHLNGWIIDRNRISYDNTSNYSDRDTLLTDLSPSRNRRACSSRLFALNDAHVF